MKHIFLSTFLFIPLLTASSAQAFEIRMGTGNSSQASQGAGEIRGTVNEQSSGSNRTTEVIQYNCADTCARKIVDSLTTSNSQTQTKLTGTQYKGNLELYNELLIQVQY
jgi:hypothetical protein